MAKGETAQTVRETALLNGAEPGDVEQAAGLLMAGEVVAFPTETVYGLGADATNGKAILKVFEAKGRPSDNPLIVHVASLEEMRLCGRIDDRAERLVRAFMPGPLTIVVPASNIVPSIARAGLPTVALRIPNHPVALRLLERTGPLVAPSANLSGRPSPTTARHVLDDLRGRIAAVLDGGSCTVGIESTVLDLGGERPAILRPGVIEPEAIEGVLGETVAHASGDAAKAEAPRAPGMKYRHYAPGVPVRLVIAHEPPAEIVKPGASGMADDNHPLHVLTTARHAKRFAGHHVSIISEALLYALFREAEEEGAGIIVFAEPGELPEGLLNRIRKAAEGG